MRAWSETNPAAAIDWALHQDELRIPALEAALSGAVRASGEVDAVEIGRALLKSDPAIGAAYGTVLVGTLTASREFQTALQFANEAPADLQPDWMANTFRRWGASDPIAAAKMLDRIGDAPARAAAFQALTESWAENDPAALANYVVTLPQSNERAEALHQAVAKWAQKDPVALAEWLKTLQPGPEFDLGAALFATLTDRANRSTDAAREWAESISDTNLRRATLEYLRTE